jgi:hypothetical protein
MHEHTQELVFDGLDLPDALVFAWVIPATAIVVAFAAWQRTFFRQLRPWLRRRLVVAGVAYVGAAVGLEIVEGALFAADSMTASTTFLAICGVEEVVEMTAIAVALLALLAELLRLAPGWSLTLTAAPGEAPADSRVGSRVAGTPAFERADAR